MTTLCRIGVLSDIQYSDTENGSNYRRTRIRYYRETVRHVERAIRDWGLTSAQPKVDLVIDLGDHLDGRCHQLGHTEEALEKLRGYFSGVTVPVHHLVGNHELYNFSRKDLWDTFLFREARGLTSAAAAADDLCYYSLTPAPGFRVVILDAYDVSILGRDEDDPRYQAALRLLVSHNTNEDLNDHSNIEKPNFVMFNGGIGETQMRWLEAELQAARENAEHVVVCNHVPVHSCCSKLPENLLWNWDDVTDLFSRYSDVVKLFLCGHTHSWKQGVSEAGIVHCSLPGLIETSPDEVGVAILELSTDEIRLLGEGGVVEDLSIKLT